MRIQFGGSFKGSSVSSEGGTFKIFEPINILYTTPGDYTFDKTLYPDHTNYDIIVIAGGGGYGGAVHAVDPENSDYDMFVYGGAGGGGGFHRLSGLLELLDDTTDLTVGAAGANGTSTTDPDTATDGSDGEASSFGDIVIASPGLGGKHPVSVSSAENAYADGGEGGMGGISEAVDYLGTLFAGGFGGICALNDDPEDPGHAKIGESGQNGKLVTGPVEVGTVTDYIGVVHTGVFTKKGLVGQGGGGGAGGAVRHDTALSSWFLKFNPTNGGRGSYNLDEAVYSPYGPPLGVTPTGAPSPFLAKAGRGGGARITPFNKSNATYGDSPKNGVVIIRLTAE